MSIEYQKESILENRSLLEEMASLYSNHYGVWGKTSGKHGERIKLSPARIQSWVQSEHTYIATARDEKKLIGYAIAVVASTNKQEYNNPKKLISWVTQLVVHEEHRQKGIAKTLLFSFWGFSNYYAWGILSASPYAIRALESATKRKSIPAKIKQKHKKIIKFGIDYINYITRETEFFINKEASKANTNFPSDISDINDKLANVKSDEVPWNMGMIDEGWEWFAFTFNDQKRKKLTSNEVEELLKSSDEMAVQAYSRMPMDDKSQGWAKFQKHEIDFLIEQCKLSVGASILDVGCGTGRHSLELAHRGYNVLGVDYANELITQAERKGKDKNVNAKFARVDFRNSNLQSEYDTVLCVYDVIGSFVDEKKNEQIIENIYKHTKNNKYALISVMNFELTEFIAKYKFQFANNPDDIFEIPASNTMEKTGNIFNPKYFAVDKDNGIVYRREQFSMGTNLQTELIVRDKRYTREEICSICEKHGFKIIFSRYVQAGKWDVELASTDKKAKEILVLCQKIN